MFKKIIYFSVFLLILLALFVLPASMARAQTAEIFFAPDSASAKPTDLLQVSVFLQTEITAPINALEASIAVPANVKIINIKTADSVINFWIEPPQFDPVTNTIKFSGIIPGGFTGVLSPFRSERQPGKLFDLILTSNSPEKIKTKLDWQSAQALLNKPEVTELALRTKSLSLTFDAQAVNSVPVPTIAVDTDPPEHFQPQIARDENILDGRWFVAFSTRDTGLGVKSYEIAEHVKASLSKTDLEKLDWQIATSPHVLRDQTRASYVSIRAVDLAGNTRIETLAPATNVNKSYPNYQFWLIIIILCIAALCYHYFYSVYSRHR